MRVVKTFKLTISSIAKTIITSILVAIFLAVLSIPGWTIWLTIEGAKYGWLDWKILTSIFGWVITSAMTLVVCNTLSEWV